ncbi:hypothetical protein GCM10027059_43310 [Myceligenerans halotolerans]
MATRLIQGSVRIDGVDDEDWPWNDETAWSLWDPVTFRLNFGNPPERLYFERKWGGECRVEVDLAAAVILESGTAELTGSARLYEGDSEDTQDLEEEEPIQVTLLRNVQKTREIHLLNEGLGGGDRATVTLSFNNVPYEAPGE